MKYLIGVIEAGALDALTEALGNGKIYRLTVNDVEVVASAADSDSVGDGRWLRVEVAVNHDFVEPALRAFERLRELGFAGEVTVLPLDQVVRIRTGEQGPEAI